MSEEVIKAYLQQLLLISSSVGFHSWETWISDDNKLVSNEKGDLKKISSKKKDYQSLIIVRNTGMNADMILHLNITGGDFSSCSFASHFKWFFVTAFLKIHVSKDSKRQEKSTDHQWRSWIQLHHKFQGEYKPRETFYYYFAIKMVCESNARQHEVLHFFQRPGLSSSKLRDKLHSLQSCCPNVLGIQSEFCFNVETAGTFSFFFVIWR